jgi:hypothetical protein
VPGVAPPPPPPTGWKPSLHRLCFGDYTARLRVELWREGQLGFPESVGGVGECAI